VVAGTERAESPEGAAEVHRFDVRVLPSPETMGAVIDAIPSHQPGNRMYQVMTAVSYYAGLRPSEVVMLRPRR